MLQSFWRNKNVVEETQTDVNAFFGAALDASNLNTKADIETTGFFKYSVFHRFWQTKFAYGGLILNSS
jgi:hypothetical protein